MSPELEKPSAQIRKVAEHLAPALASFEVLCLDVGERLGRAVPGLHTLSGLLASVSAELTSPAMLGANDGLEAVSREIAGFSEMLGREEADIGALAELLTVVGAHVEVAQGCARTLGALVFSLRIEAAQWAGRNTDMMNFAKSLRELVDRVRDSLNDCALARAALHSRLRAAAIYLAAFKEKHGARMGQLAQAVERSMTALAHSRAHAAALLADVAAQSREMGEHIGACVAALQIGDSSRQRAEHVAQALALAANALESPDPQTIPDVGAPFDGDRRHLARRILELQRRQIAGAMLDFTQETARIADIVARLATDAGAVACQGLRLFGADEAGDASFLQTLEGDLSGAREVVEEGARTRADVDEAKRSAAETLQRLESRIGVLSSIASEVSMIGTNASLRSSRMGEEGKGVSLIAAELRELGRQIRTATEQIALRLGDIAVCMNRVSFLRGADAASLADLGTQVARTAETFGATGQNVAQALQTLRAETTRARDELGFAAHAMASREHAVRQLAEAQSEIEAIAGALPPAGEGRAQVDRFLDEVLGPTYSMVAERRIHSELTGAFAQALDTAAPVADAFML